MRKAMDGKSAAELIAAGYRLHWVTIEKEIPVLCKPEDADDIDGFTAEQWARDDGSEWGMMARPMRGADAETRKCLAFCEDIEGDPPTIGELLNAQAAAGEGA
jgi:hypothetical protein